MTEQVVVREAIVSPCEAYRYALWRRWGFGSQVLFVGLNPSTADAETDDPTLRRCVGFAKRWGHSAVAIGNLFALRSTNPRGLETVEDPRGPENERWLRTLIAESARVVLAWGVRGTYRGMDQRVLRLLHAVISPFALPTFYHLGLTKDGQPRHPLYLRRDAALIPWEWSQTT